MRQWHLPKFQINPELSPFAQLAEYLDARTTVECHALIGFQFDRSTVRNWRAGRRKAPTFILDRLRLLACDKADRLADLLNEMRPGDGDEHKRQAAALRREILARLAKEKPAGKAGFPPGT